MAIFGIGARYGADDVTEEFISRDVACVGWSESDAPPAYAILRQIRTGDLVFIESFTPQAGLTIKAVGVVTEGRSRPVTGLGSGVPVRWVWRGEERVGRLEDRWPVRSVTIYEEHHPTVQARAIDLLLAHSR